MAGRTFETGGEVLAAGDTVIVFDGNSQKEREIISVGTRRVQITGMSQNPVPYSLETRRSQSGAYESYFRTKTEVAEMNRRSALRGTLRALGVEPVPGGSLPDGFAQYPVSVLEELVAVLEGHQVKVNQGQSQAG